MVDTIGERRPPYANPKPPDKNLKKEPSIFKRIATRLGIGAAAGAAIASATGNADKIVDPVKDALGSAFEVTTPNEAGIKNAKAELEKKGIKLGDPRPSAVNKDPEGIILQHGSLGDITYGGSIGVKTVNQELIIRSGEPSMNGKKVSVEELKEKGFNPKDVWMVEVWGGPDRLIQPGEKGEASDWVMFTLTDQHGNQNVYYTAQKFAEFDGQKMLEMKKPDGSKVKVPFIPIGK